MTQVEAKYAPLPSDEDANESELPVKGFEARTEEG